MSRNWRTKPSPIRDLARRINNVPGWVGIYPGRGPRILVTTPLNEYRSWTISQAEAFLVDLKAPKANA